MERIEFLNTNRLKNDEHYQFMSDVKTLVEKTTHEVLDITGLYSTFTSAFAQEDKVMKIALGSAKTETLKKLDSTRDQTWNACNRRIEATVIGPIPEEIPHAIAIKRVIDVYGDKRKEAYKIESASLTNLVADLLSDINKPHLEALGMLSWINALKSQNEAFIAEFNSRNEELSEKISGDADIVRVPLDEAYVKIVNRINATIELSVAKAGVEKFVKQLNEEIAYYNNMLAIRKGRKLAEEKEGPPKS